jgi:uncharacterized membrane protein HdeD (DUF308 family)
VGEDHLLILLQFVGIYWLISGLFAIIEIFAANRTASWGWLLFYGIVGILAGLAILRHPLVSMIPILTVLVVFLGIAGIVIGIVGLIQGFTGRGGWTIVPAVLDILIGVFLLARPLITALALPLLIGIFAIIAGISLIIAAFRIHDRGTSPGEPGQGMPVG